jgi:hypothetical protein
MAFLGHFASSSIVIVRIKRPRLLQLRLHQFLGFGSHLYDAQEERLDDIPYIGEYRVRQLKNVVAQAIWL